MHASCLPEPAHTKPKFLAINAVFQGCGFCYRQRFKSVQKLSPSNLISARFTFSLRTPKLFRAHAHPKNRDGFDWKTDSSRLMAAVAIGSRGGHAWRGGLFPTTTPLVDLATPLTAESKRLHRRQASSSRAKEMLVWSLTLWWQR
jgi:hypothetical protein